MSGAGSMVNLAIVGAGMAVIIGVVALLTAIEVSKRLQIMVKDSLAEADVKLSSAIEKQDKKISTLRQVMSELAEDNETAIRRMQEDLKQIRETQALMTAAIHNVEDRVEKATPQQQPEGLLQGATAKAKAG